MAATSPGIEVRMAEIGDVGKLIELRSEFLRSQIDAGLLDIPNDPDSHLAATTLGLVTGARTHVWLAQTAAEGEVPRLCGYLYGMAKVVPGVQSSMIGSIEEAFVRPEARGTGLADALVAAALTTFEQRGASRVQLKVLSGNPAARSFWSRMGFVENLSILEYAPSGPPPVASDTLRSRLLRAERANYNRPALWVEGRTWTYGQLFADAWALAARIDQEIAPGEPLGIFCQRDRLSLIGILAAALSRRPYVPLNPTFPLDRIAAIAAVARPAAVLSPRDAGGQHDALMLALPAGTVVLDEFEALGHGTGPTAAAIEDPTRATSDPTAYMMFTSGTTGVPKGVRVLERNLLAYLDGIAPIATIGPGDRATQFFDLSFDLSVHDIFVTWTSGAELSVLPKERSMSVETFIRDRRITHWFSVPSLAAFCDRLGQLTPDSLAGLKVALFCGEPLAVTLARRFAAAASQARIWNIYGPTEATIAFTAYEIARQDCLDGLSTVPLGWPLGAQKIRTELVVGADHHVGEELLLGGSQIALGYMNNAEQNAAKFFQDSDGVTWYRTGDLVQISEEHGLIFLGRTDDQVKINGYRVELMEIDAALREASGTPEVAALPWPVSNTGHADQIVAFVVGSKASTSDIRKHCREILPAYMVPRKVMVIDRMPLSASGKIDRKALRALLELEKA